MDIITNKATKNHLGTLRELIGKSENICICVAFLKKSGFDLVKTELETSLKRGAKVRFICGLDLFLTEPRALREILLLFKKYQGGSLFLFRSDKATFHPKLYYFSNEKAAHVLIGSANFSKGGFHDNVEISALRRITVGSDIHKEINSFFNEIENSSHTERANDLNISSYEVEYDIVHKKMSRADKDARREIKGLKRLDLSTMKRHLEEYNRDEKEQDGFRFRLSNYAKAREMLNQMCDIQIGSKAEFLAYYERLVGRERQRRLWQSNGLFRRKNQVASEFRIFMEMLRRVRHDVARTPAEVFEIGLRYVKQVRGLGVNVLTEIMNTYDSRKFAVLNNNPLTALEYFGFARFPEPNSFRAGNYESFNSLIGELMRTCGFKSMGQVDHFLNYVYQTEIKGTKHQSRRQQADVMSQKAF